MKVAVTVSILGPINWIRGRGVSRYPKFPLAQKYKEEKDSLYTK
jgi:hypothetical protein